MTQHLVFSNPGEIDPRALSILGVNVKQGDSPIGFFGTGLKYAIATTLRLGGRIEIYSGLTKIQFEARTESIRGKDFGLIYMEAAGEARPLGFTTDLGKTWLPWMVYRELWCNAHDEAGDVYIASQMPTPEAGQTQIIVSWPDLLAVHAERHKYILQGTPLLSTKNLDIHPGNSTTLFYRGIAVATLPKTSLYTYNLKAKQQLTEDRTLDSYRLRMPLVETLMESAPPQVLRHVLLASEASYESELDFNWSHVTPSGDFVATVEELYQTKLVKLSRSAVTRCRASFTKPELAQVKLTIIEQKMLGKALDFLARLGHEVKEEIRVVDTLGSQWTLGMTKDGKILLPKSLFGKGTKYLASTLLEEHLHIARDLPDCSRAMQDWLFDRVVSLGEELQGEPL